MFFTIIAILILIYLLSIPAILKHRFGKKAVIIFRSIIFLSTPLLIVALTAQSSNIYPRGYWFIKILFWIDAFSLLSIYGLCKREFLWKSERIIYKIIFFLPLAFLPFLLIPFIGIGSGIIFYTNFIGNSKFILYYDNNIRIEQPNIRFMGPNPQPVIYIKHHLISYRDKILPWGYDDVKDSIEVRKKDESTYVILIKSPDNWQIPNGTDSVLYSPKNETSIQR